MKKNIGSTDRVIRVVAALAIGLLLISGFIAGTTAIVLGALAVVFLATSAVSSCPLYLPFGVSTRKQG